MQVEPMSIQYFFHEIISKWLVRLSLTDWAHLDSKLVVNVMQDSPHAVSFQEVVVTLRKMQLGAFPIQHDYLYPSCKS